MSKIRLIFACLSALLLCSCVTNEGGKDDIGYFPVQLEEDGRWSMIGPDGKILFKDEFKEAPTAVVNGVFVVREGETYSVYRASEKPELIVEGLKSAGAMSDGLIPTVKKDGRITLIDKDGKKKFLLESYDGKEVIECHNLYSEGLLGVKTGNGKWGYVDTKGEMVISPKYDYANPFNGDYAIVSNNKNDSDNSSQYIINKKGEIVLDINERYGYITEIKDGLMSVRDSAKEKNGFLNVKGEFISVPSKVNIICDFNKDVFVFCNKEWKYGVISLDENYTQLIRPKYDNITIISSNEFLVRSEDKFYVVNNEDQKIIDLSDYEDVMPSPISTTQCYIAKEGNVWVLLDKEGKQIGNSEFYFYVSQNVIDYEGYDNIYSDYFDAQGVTNAIEDYLEECMATYVIGESMSKYVTNPEECNLNTESYSVPNFDKKGSGINLTLRSNSPYIKNNKSINANSKLKEIELSFWELFGYDVFPYSEKIDKQVANILESKGFKKEEGDDDYPDVFVKDDVRIMMVLSQECGYCITISKKEIKKASNVLTFSGTIANVKCRMDLDLTSGKGTLSYNTKASSMFYLEVSEYYDYGGVKTYDGMTIEEYDYNGNHTGKMVGEYYDTSYSGTYYRHDGKEFEFSFELTK